MGRPPMFEGVVSRAADCSMEDTHQNRSDGDEDCAVVATLMTRTCLNEMAVDPMEEDRLSLRSQEGEHPLSWIRLGCFDCEERMVQSR